METPAHSNPTSSGRRGFFAAPGAAPGAFGTGAFAWGLALSTGADGADGVGEAVAETGAETPAEVAEAAAEAVADGGETGPEAALAGSATTDDDAGAAAAAGGLAGGRPRTTYRIAATITAAPTKPAMATGRTTLADDDGGRVRASPAIEVAFGFGDEIGVAFGFMPTGVMRALTGVMRPLTGVT